jgi:Lrp/AsnC family leucine-responsive transcriptional regulator
MNNSSIDIDPLDLKILLALLTDGRITWAKLGSDIGLSGPSTVERVRKLERRGIIDGYTVQVDPEALGYGLLAFISVSMSDASHHHELLGWVAATPEVQECHVVAGAHDYLLKVRCRNSAHLEELLREHVRAIPGVAHTESTIAMVTAKETNAVPVAQVGTGRLGGS